MLGPHDEWKYFDSTCDEDDEDMESKIEVDFTSLEGITPNNSPFENLEGGDRMSPLEEKN